MNWEETIRHIRKDPAYKELVEYSYLDEDLTLNVERFKSSQEFSETIKLIDKYAPNAKTLLDIGSGNGISAIAFALKGFQVTAAEPDPSETVGCGAIRILKKKFHLDSLNLISSFGENLPLEGNQFDVVYIRQAMHHAADLKAFVKEASRVLKPGGLLLTIRDHVIYGSKDKQIFLEVHPLQKFYGGENAFTSQEYENAMAQAGLTVKRRIKYYDSAINFFPVSDREISKIPAQMKQNFISSLQKRFGSWVVNFPFLQLLEMTSQFKNGRWSDERRIPGRMNSFIALKNPL